MPVDDDPRPRTPEDEERWVWVRRKVHEASWRKPAAPRTKKGFLRMPQADRSQKFTLRVSYKGGPESYWLIEARGEHQVFAGWWALEDVMARVLSER